MNIFKKILFTLTVLIVAFHTRVKAQKQYYSKVTYPYDTCEVRYDSSNHLLILYSGKNIDSLLLQKDEKVQIEYWKNNYSKSNWYNLLINSKSVKLKKGLDGFGNHKEIYEIKINHASHYSGSSDHASHYSHISHISGN